MKVYVPLRGVQTDMLRTTFTPTSVEVKFPITFGAQAENQNVLSRATLTVLGFVREVLIVSLELGCP